MTSLDDYASWKGWALAEDARSGADRWKDQDASDLYDHRVIRLRYDELVEVRASGDAHRLLYYLNEGLHGNMGGMGSPALYTRARFGTKTLITRYVHELVAALEDLEQADELALAEKLACLERAQGCFGRSALMLSGAGSLGAFHLGVAKALLEHQLVPRVVSGASAGSIIAGLLGTHPDDRLEALFADDGIVEHFAGLQTVARSSGGRERIRVGDLRDTLAAVLPDMTFLEAFETTGRQINVSVAPATLHQRSRLLNAVTSPNAFVREAILASCAVPGVFPPVTLAARDAAGARRPYVPSRQWVDGSITDDQPARRLARLYGINHFISSQANPIVLWASRDHHGPDGLLARLGGISFSAVRQALRAVYPAAMGAVRNLDPVNTYTRLWFSVMTQEYSADVNIVPSRRFHDPTSLLARLYRHEFEALVRDGERSTWPKIEIIRNCTEISRHIEGALARLGGRSRFAEALPA